MNARLCYVFSHKTGQPSQGDIAFHLNCELKEFNLGLTVCCSFPDSSLCLQTAQSLNSQITKHADCPRGEKATKNLSS